MSNQNTSATDVDRRGHHDPSAPVVDLSGVEYRYNDHIVLKDVSFRLEAGEHVAVVGPNGAGKSTLFKLIAGIIKPREGDVRIGGTQPSGHICVAYIPQRNTIDWTFPVTVFDVVMMGRVGRLGWFKRAGAPDRDFVMQCLQLVGMEHHAARQIAQLSGGEQQRMFIARALAQEAEVMLMDEVLAGCDVSATREIYRILDMLRSRRVTIMTATHDLDEAATHYDRVMLLHGRIVGFGKAEQIFTPDLLSEAYGHHLRLIKTEGGLMVLSDTCCDGGHRHA